jgi:hypothetical protein
VYSNDRFCWLLCLFMFMFFMRFSLHHPLKLLVYFWYSQKGLVIQRLSDCIMNVHKTTSTSSDLCFVLCVAHLIIFKVLVELVIIQTSFCSFLGSRLSVNIACTFQMTRKGLVAFLFFSLFFCSIDPQTHAIFFEYILSRGHEP